MPQRVPLKRLALLTALVLLGFSAAPRQVSGQADSAVALSVSAGFDGYYKEGFWVPVQVRVENQGPAFTGSFTVVTNRYDGSQTTYLRRIELPTQSRKEFFIYVAPEAVLRQAVVTLMDGRQEMGRASARLTQVGSGDLIFAVLAGSPSVFNTLADVDPAGGSGLVAVLELSQLPEDSRSLSAVDVIVLSDVDTGSLSDSRREALTAWVGAGGTLLVAGGPSWQRTTSGLEALLPLELDGTRTLTGLSSLERLAPDGPRLEGSAVATTGSLRPEAIALAEQDGVTLAAYRTVGAGQVLFLAADPSLAPLRNWDGVAALYRSLLTAASAQPLWTRGISNGYYALQAASALPGLDLPSVYQLCGFLFAYVAAIGPINYLVLRRLKRPQWAWLTIPALVVGFTGLAYGIGREARGRDPVLERLAVVQVWPDSETAHVDGIVAVYSPRRLNYDVTVGENFLLRPLPASSGALGSGLTSETLEQAAGTSISDLRVEVGGLRVFLAEGITPAPAYESSLEYQLGQSSAVLSGAITNRSSYDLQDAVVLAVGASQRLGALGAGQSRQVSINLNAERAIPGQLTGKLGFSGPSGPLPAGQPNPSFFFGGYDQVINEVLGTSDYFRDRNSYRRYSLLLAMLDPNSGSAGLSSGVFLLGWSKQSALPAEIRDRRSSFLDETLVIVSLRPQLTMTGNRLVVPPALFMWAAGERDLSQGVDLTPYDMFVPRGSYALTFRPYWGLPYRKVQALTLHLTSYDQTGTASVTPSLWDFQEAQWQSLGRQPWGDIPVPEPAQFVGPGGEIRLRIENTGGASSVNIERSDFTLTVNQ